MVREKYGVRLEPEQRDRLEHLVRAGKSSARVTTRGADTAQDRRRLVRAPGGAGLGCGRGHGVPDQAALCRDWGGRGAAGPAPGPSVPEAGRPGGSPQDMTTGPCACWPARWWSWGWRPPCPTRRCASGSKKRPQAVAEAGVVHPQGERRLRRPYGGCPGPVCRTL